jgi:hypothetical protein
MCTQREILTDYTKEILNEFETKIVATFPIIQFVKLYPEFFAHTEGQIIWNNNFDICFDWLLHCFGR